MEAQPAGANPPACALAEVNTHTQAPPGGGKESSR
jgi:hypothetical protein